MEIQKNILLAYKQYRSSPPTALTMMLRGWRVVLLLTFAILTFAGLALFLQMNHLVWFVAGSLIGAVAREFGLLRHGARSWPTISAVIDWNRVDELLAKEQT